MLLLYRISAAGEVALHTDVSLAREAADPESEPIVNPLVAASARVVATSDFVALVAGNNTAPDSGGTRHQKAVTTVIDADPTGAAVAPSQPRRSG